MKFLKNKYQTSSQRSNHSFNRSSRPSWSQLEASMWKMRISRSKVRTLAEIILITNLRMFLRNFLTHLSIQRSYKWDLRPMITNNCLTLIHISETFRWDLNLVVFLATLIKKINLKPNRYVMIKGSGDILVNLLSNNNRN